MRRYKPKPKKPQWRTNEYIRASEVRVIDDRGEQVGVMSATEALARAKEVEKDLIEIAPMAKPPVVKIMEFGKFKYQEEKRAKKQKKGVKKTDIKEVRFSPFIGEADYTTRLKRVKEFFGDGHKVRAVVKFKGRQMGSKKHGYDLLKRLVNEFGENVNVDMEPKFIGRHLSMVISPKSNVKKTTPQNEEEKLEKNENK